MNRWSGLILVLILLAAFFLGLLIDPADSQTNLETASWHATYFDNSNLRGEPVTSRFERSITYNWSEAAPLGVPEDNFSARWVGRFRFSEGQWRFTAGADDGVRLWVDDILIIDQWESTGQFITYSADQFLEAGEHTVKVEYFEATGLAGISVRWTPTPIVPTSPPPPSSDDTAPDSGSDTSDTEPAPPPVYGYVATSTLNLYDGPGIQHRRLGQVFLYQRFAILGKTEDGAWYLIDLKNNRTGWVSSNFILRTGVENVPVLDNIGTGGPVAVTGVTRRIMQVYPGPSPEDEIIDTLPRNTGITVLGRSADSHWYQVEYEDRQGWMFAPGIELIDSLARDLPILP